MNNNQSDKTIYQLDEATSAQLKSILTELDKFCFSNRLPFFVSVATENTEDKTVYTNYVRTSAPMGITLSQDKIINYMRVYRGYEVIAPEDLPDVVMSSQGA